MKTILYKILFVVLIILNSFNLINCQQVNKNSLLGRYNFKDKGNKEFILEKSLNEISGLADAGNNFLYTHNDEKADIYKFDLNTGEVVLKFSLGDTNLLKDFEGIAVNKDTIYLATSSGVIYRFNEGEDNEAVAFEKIRTGLKPGNNVEGLCYDPERNSLLLACKDAAKKKYKRFRTVYEYNLTNNILIDNPRFLISLDELKDRFSISDFAPSGIERHPLNGNFFIISANEPAVIEISPEGVLLNAVKLKNRKYRQTEGITILKDNSLILSDEAKGKKAKLTIIPFK